MRGGVLREILHHQPENHSAMWLLALASYQLNDQQQAEMLVTQLLQKSSGQLWGNLLRGALTLPLSEVDEPLTDLAPVNETAHYLEILQNEKIFEMIFGDPLLQHIMQNQP